MKKLNQTEQILRQEILARKLATPQQLDDELTIPFMQNCHSKINQYLSLVRPDDVENAYNKPARIEAGRQELERAKAKKFWQNPTASEHQAEYTQAGDTFADTHPAFTQIRSNLQEMGLELAKQNLNPTLDNLNKVYRDLVLAGRLTLAIENMPNALKDAPAEATGIFLQRWIKLMPSLLDPVVQKSESEVETEYVKSLSADEFKKQRMLPNDTLPPVIQRRIESDIREFCNNHPSYDPSEAGKEILLSWIREQGWHVCHDSLEASFAANQEKLHAANCIFATSPDIPVHYNASTLTDHRKPYIPPIERPITLEPSPTAKRIDMDKLLALPADEFQRVVNGTPGLRELLDGERS